MLGLPIMTILRDLLKLGEGSREIRKILNFKQILVDGRRVKEPKFIAGLFDVIQIPDLKLSYRISINQKGKLYLCALNAEEANIKICRIVNKHILQGGKMNLTFHDGKNQIVKDSNYNVGDSVLFEFGKGIVKRIEMKKGATILLVGGKHIGVSGQIVDIIKKKIVPDEAIIKTKQEQFSTLKKYAYVIGEEKPLIKI